MTQIETRFKVRFDSTVGATYAEAGVARSYNDNLLQDEIALSISMDKFEVCGLDNIRRLRDLCDRFLEHNEAGSEVQAGRVTTTRESLR